MIYFASDFHLGYPNYESSRKREDLIISWLDEIRQNATQVHLVGDIFDFWFEWKRVVPKYFVRFMGKIAQLTDAGIEVHFYIGNHDIWTFGYLEKELGMIVHRSREIQQIYGKRFFIEHGDQTPFESKIYKIMTKVFRNRMAQWAFAKVLHPDFASRIAQGFSARRDRESEIAPYQGHSERQLKYVKWLQQNGFQADFYVFGHRHLAYTEKIGPSTMVLLGHWFAGFNSYAVFDGEKIEIKRFSKL